MRPLQSLQLRTGNRSLVLQNPEHPNHSHRVFHKNLRVRRLKFRSFENKPIRCPPRSLPPREKGPKSPRFSQSLLTESGRRRIAEQMQDPHMPIHLPHQGLALSQNVRLGVPHGFGQLPLPAQGQHISRTSLPHVQPLPNHHKKGKSLFHLLRLRFPKPTSLYQLCQRLSLTANLSHPPQIMKVP